MTREQAAEKWHNDRYVKMIPSPFPFDKYNHTKQGYEDFLAGCAHVDREHREFYLLVREYLFLTDTAIMHTPESQKLCDIDNKIRKHLTAFTEREVQSLPFPPSNQE